MKRGRFHRWAGAAGIVALFSTATVVTILSQAGNAQAGLFGHGKAACCAAEGPPTDDIGGTWYWLRSPDEEKRVVAGLFNRYCIRCHGVDGRGVWDIPGVPDFTNPHWQASRSDGQLARNILEGRGAVMPPFRGTLTLEESWAMARYLRTFVPGTEIMRPELGSSGGQPSSKSP